MIPISAAERAILDEQVATGAAATVEEYVSTLIAADARLKAQERLETLLLEGLESEPLEATPELFNEIRRKAGLLE